MKINTSRKAGFTLVEIMIVVAIIGLLAAIAIPNFVKARNTSQANACINNMRQIDSGIQQWALENNKRGFRRCGFHGRRTLHQNGFRSARWCVCLHPWRHGVCHPSVTCANAGLTPPHVSRNWTDYLVRPGRSCASGPFCERLTCAK